MNKSNCTIFDNSFFSDLYKYDIYGNNIFYDNNEYSEITSSIPPLVNSDTSSGIWKLSFMDNSENFIENKIILGKTQIKNKIIGIESALKFKPQCKHWEFSDNTRMICNWYINSMSGGYDAEYGAGFWYRDDSYDDPVLPANQTIFGLAPNFTSFVALFDIIVDGNIIIPKDSVVIKLSDTKVLISSIYQQRYVINDTTVSFPNTNAIRDVSGVQNIDGQLSIYHYGNITAGDRRIKLWISDGECFSYYFNKNDKKLHNASGLQSRTYLSPGLFGIYRAIYHSLTKFMNRPITLSRRRAMALQKLCYFLSTAPQMDRTTVDILASGSVISDVLSYLDHRVDTIEQEKELLLNVVNNIMSQYYILTNPVPNTSFNNNLISTYDQLYNKLLSKYGAFIWAPPGEKIDCVFKDRSISKHVALSIGSINTYPKKDIVDPNTTLYNNFEIRLGNLAYSTKLSDSQSTFLLRKYEDSEIKKEIEVPLSDISLPKISLSHIKAGGYRRYTFEPGNSRDGGPTEMVFETKTYASTDGESTSSYNWEHYGGPSCIRFSDSSKDARNINGNPLYPPVKRFTSSSDENPLIFIKTPGQYEIKLTRTAYRNIVQSDILILDNNTVTDPDLIDFVGVDQENIQTDYNKVLCSSLKTIAFHKKGLIWLIDSDQYYYQGINNTLDSDDFGIYGVFRLQDVKMNVSPPDKLEITENDGYGADGVTEYGLYLRFSGGNCGTLVLSASIEHMRDDTKDKGNCKSFFRERIIRNRQRINSPILGASDFTRESIGTYRFVPKPENGEDVKEIVFSDPGVSTFMAPPVYAYGGYNQQKVEKLGIYMPYHPLPAGDCISEIPELHFRNPFDHNSENVDKPVKKYCFPEEVSPSGNHYMTFYPGIFRPDSGWDPSINGSSYVISDKLSQHSTITLKGAGFFNMRPGGTYSSSIYVDSALAEKDKTIMNTYGIGGVDTTTYSTNSSRVFKEYTKNTWDTSTDYDDYNSSNICGGMYTLYSIADIDAFYKTVIDNVEIRLNFLNYFNPKALTIWIESINYNPQSPPLELLSKPIPEVDDDFPDARNTIEAIKNYLTSVQSNNSSRIYLLMQEYVQNYVNNFVVTFSDYADKYKTTCKYTTGNSKYKNVYKQNLLYNNDKIMPTLKTSQYSDLESENIEFEIKANRFNNTPATMYRLHTSLPALKLSQVGFTLYIKVNDYLFNDGTIMDNLLNNNELSGNVSVDNYKTSNTVMNSLCSWEVILNPGLKNPGDNHIKPPGYGTEVGYDYMCDFTGYEYLIPKVNINAPYETLANINNCYYVEENLSRGVRAQKAEFPSLLPYFMVGIGFGFGTIIGGLTAIYAAQMFYANGGRNDPIVNYFIETSLLRQSQNVNGQYYKPIYDEQYFGRSDKALIAVSEDEIYWYGLEVPIFRYTNTNIFRPNKYKYIKVVKNTLGELSDIPYTAITTIDNLDLLFPKDFYHYNVGDEPINTGTLPDKYILMNGARPAKLFTKGDDIFVSSINDFAKIENIATYATSSGSQTIMELSKSVAGTGYISKKDNDTILIYKDEKTSIIDNKKYFSSWAFDKTVGEVLLDQMSPSQRDSTYSPGSIGWGTTQVDPDILYRLSPNSNLPVKDIIDNTINDITYNFSVYDDSRQGYSYVSGWPSYIEDYSYIVHNDGFPKSPTGLTVHTLENKPTPIFFELRSPNFIGMPNEGYISISNDFVREQRVGVPQDQIDSLRSRLDSLRAELRTALLNNNPNATGLAVQAEKLDDILLRVTSGPGHLYGNINNDELYIAPQNKSLYWIHIDPEQPSILLDELTVKVPVDSSIAVAPIVGDFIEDTQFFPNGVTINNPDADRYLQSIGRIYKYGVPIGKIEEEKTRIKNLYREITDRELDWSTDENFSYGSTSLESGDSKKMLISLLLSQKDYFLAFKEDYWRPGGTSSKNNKKIKDVINLGNTNGLKVKFRNIPRQLKSLDSEDFDKYSYSSKGILLRGFGPNGRARSVGQLGNNFVCWKCIDEKGKFVEPTPFVKNMNEMIYRAFFGSTDRIEHKSEYMDSQDPWEWIPYEYFEGSCKASKIVSKKQVGPGPKVGIGNIVYSNGSKFCMIQQMSYQTTVIENIEKDDGSWTKTIATSPLIKGTDLGSQILDIIDSIPRWTKFDKFLIGGVPPSQGRLDVDDSCPNGAVIHGYFLCGKINQSSPLLDGEGMRSPIYIRTQNTWGYSKFDTLKENKILLKQIITKGYVESVADFYYYVPPWRPLLGFKATTTAHKYRIACSKQANEDLKWDPSILYLTNRDPIDSACPDGKSIEYTKTTLIALYEESFLKPGEKKVYEYDKTEEALLGSVAGYQPIRVQLNANPDETVEGFYVLSPDQRWEGAEYCIIYTDLIVLGEPRNTCTYLDPCTTDDMVTLKNILPNCCFEYPGDAGDCDKESFEDCQKEYNTFPIDPGLRDKNLKNPTMLIYPDTFMISKLEAGMKRKCGPSPGP